MSLLECKIMASSSTTSTIADKTFKGVANLIKLLPSGTVFTFRYLAPLLTDNGQCHTVNKYLTAALLVVCGLLCFFSTFTDSRTGSDGKVHYGLATLSGFCTFSRSGSKENLSKYKLQLTDFVHAFVSLIVFTAIALLDHYIISCFYPSFESTEKAVIKALPVVIGAVSSCVFMVFPSTRHGVGYGTTDTSEGSTKS